MLTKPQQDNHVKVVFFHYDEIKERLNAIYMRGIHFYHFEIEGVELYQLLEASGYILSYDSGLSTVVTERTTLHLDDYMQDVGCSVVAVLISTNFMVKTDKKERKTFTIFDRLMNFITKNPIIMLLELLVIQFDECLAVQSNSPY